ncbi:hypothetical protein QPM17_20720 [Marinobacter sp. TBZ242]|uniref:Uncharacterized protein n=1 Tax=Marinobacter azerbaijanicus TaxID=3050455 RepID=A0ABT7IHC5_9GAMM|nr:hypothetical protein [Marinobacter sp. TBZ242]MDL0433571.1 hypothetical protein [Marinobacter sp. TBZ242]
MQTISGVTSWLFPLAAVLVAALSMPRVVQASGDFYLLYRHWQPYDWPEYVPSASEVSRSQRGLGWSRHGAMGAIGADYDYQPLRIRTGEPAHNGHLHRLVFTGHWQHRLYRLETRAGVAGTSNMFKHQTFHSDVVNGRVAMFRALGEGSPLSLGVGGDHRFGSFQWLPRARWEHAHESGRWLIDLPIMLWWQSYAGRWELLLKRTGDRWATLDQDQEVEGALYLREWRAELTYRIRSAEEQSPEMVVGLGASVDTRVRYRDLEAGTVDRRLGDALLGTIRLNW